eukprot:scaffold1397_cov254-Pinguiococcus_pyrenoidosus.AAC.2
MIAAARRRGFGSSGRARDRLDCSDGLGRGKVAEDASSYAAREQQRTAKSRRFAALVAAVLSPAPNSVIAAEDLRQERGMKQGRHSLRGGNSCDAPLLLQLQLSDAWTHAD